ncbi:pilus assembly PilX N-terminal domain-containing protein [Patescibacteria group bacterium]|nr:pilus assembly PilX N-terminal domain-containing protein [Patescibacteria group bacterium]MBU1754895.1 pilus assembly PilX N-terminal domain-containing protein [Patescibacteria group bacterium]
MISTQPRGFTLLIAVILSSVVLTIGLALLDMAYKQVILASTAKQSQKAFYAADSALECALYYDQQKDAFNTNFDALTQLSCDGQVISYAPSGSSPKVTTYSVPCAGGGTQASVRVYKNYPIAPTTRIYANGYNSCNADDARRVERGLKVVY